MFKKLFKNKPVGFYFALAASVLSLFLAIFYAVYMGANNLFNAGVFILYLCAFLLPLVYFFIQENDLTRLIPIFQTTFLALAFGINFILIGDKIVYYVTDTYTLADTTAAGGVLMFVIVATAVTMVVSLVASFMRQTKKLTAEQQAEVDEDWTNFKTNTKEFAVRHKTPLIIGGAGAVVLIAFIIVLFAVIIPAALVVHVDSVKFEQESVVMYETDKLRLKPVISPEDAENKKVIYSTSDPEVATVTENGVVEALKTGEVTITAMAEDGEAVATCKVTIKELKVESTEIVEMPNTLHYLYGQNEEFSSSGISIVATLSNGKTQKITKGKKYGLTFTADEKYMTEDGEIIVSDKKVTVTASYTFRDKTYSTEPFDVYGDAAEASSPSEFASALENTNIGYVYLTEDLALDSVDIVRDLGINGDLNTSAVTVGKDATLTVEEGRIQSSGDLRISGEGAIAATSFTTSDNTSRQAHAAIYANGSLTIGGVDVECSNIAANDFMVNGGANVTVYGKNVRVGNVGLNGVHLTGGLTITDNGTKLDILYNDAVFGSSPAAVETNGILVDNGAAFNVGSNDGCAEWGYAVWSGNGGGITARYGSKVTLSSAANTCISGIKELEVLDTSELAMDSDKYIDTDVTAKFDGTAKVIVNGTLFDMSKPLDERAFGDMTATGEVSVSADPNVTYMEGHKFTSDNVIVNATFEGGSTENKIHIALGSVAEVPDDTTLRAGENMIKVTVLGEEYEIKVLAYASSEDSRAVSSVEEFNAALSDGDVKQISLTRELSFDRLTINRTVSVLGNIKVGTLTVNASATLTMLNGRIWSDGNLTINGGGTVIATEYAPDSGNRTEYATIRSGGSLTIDGVTVECLNVAANGNAVTVAGGANVTVYGRSAKGDDGDVNGLHASDAVITVSGTGTRLNVLFDAQSRIGSPAALEATAIKVSDGAELYVGSTEGSESWAYGTWFRGEDERAEASGGACVTFDIAKPNGADGIIAGDYAYNPYKVGIYVTGSGTRFIIISAEQNWQKDIVEEGNVEWYTSASDVSDEEPKIEKIEITKQPNKTTYTEGDKLDLTGMEIVAVYDNGSKVNVSLTEVTTSVSTDVPLTTSVTEITVTYAGEFTAKFTITVNAKETSATVSREEAFKAAIENESIANITVEGDVLELTEAVNVGRDLTIVGNVKFVAPAAGEETAALAEGGESAASDGVTLTVAEGKTLTVNGYLRSDVDLTISGAGKVIVNYTADTAANRNELASVYVNGALTIGADADVYNIAATGDIAVKGGAVVNVYGKKAKADNGDVNGVHASGALKVSGNGSEMNILYNEAELVGSPAAVQATSVTVDGAELYVGSSENCVSWAFGTWLNGLDERVTVTNGAYVTFDVRKPGDFGVIAGNYQWETGDADLGVYVTGETTRFIVITVEDAFLRDVAKAGLVEWYTPEQEVPETKPVITGIKVVTQPTTLVYDEGDTFDPTGIVVKAVYGESGQESVITGMTYEPSGTLTANDTAVTVKYGEFETTIAITVRSTATSASVNTAEEFATALANASIVNITITGDFTVENATITRNITIYGSLKVKALTVNDGFTLTMADGRITSDSDLAISGSGKVVATAYAPTEGTRTDYAAVYASGAVTIKGATLECGNLAAGGNITVTEDAEVTVYCKDASGTDGGVNGVHIDKSNTQGTVTVSDSAVLKVLFNAPECHGAAAFNANIVIDGATLYVGSVDNCDAWAYGIWFDGGTVQSMTAKSGANVTFDVADGSAFNGGGKVVVEDGANVTVITDKQQESGSDVTIEGNVTWQTSEEETQV